MSTPLQEMQLVAFSVLCLSLSLTHSLIFFWRVLHFEHFPVCAVWSTAIWPTCFYVFWSSLVASLPAFLWRIWQISWKFTIWRADRWRVARQFGVQVGKNWRNMCLSVFNKYTVEFSWKLEFTWLDLKFCVLQYSKKIKTNLLTYVWNKCIHSLILKYVCIYFYMYSKYSRDLSTFLM